MFASIQPTEEDYERVVAARDDALARVEKLEALLAAYSRASGTCSWQSQEDRHALYVEAEKIAGRKR